MGFGGLEDDGEDIDNDELETSLDTSTTASTTEPLWLMIITVSYALDIAWLAFTITPQSPPPSQPRKSRNSTSTVSASRKPRSSYVDGLDKVANAMSVATTSARPSSISQPRNRLGIASESPRIRRQQAFDLVSTNNDILPAEKPSRAHA